MKEREGNRRKKSLDKERVKTNVYCRTVFHPNICLFMGATTSEQPIQIVTELLTNNIMGVLQNKGTFFPGSVSEIFGGNVL